MTPAHDYFRVETAPLQAILTGDLNNPLAQHLAQLLRQQGFQIYNSLEPHLNPDFYIYFSTPQQNLAQLTFPSLSCKNIIVLAYYPPSPPPKLSSATLVIAPGLFHPQHYFDNPLYQFLTSAHRQQTIIIPQDGLISFYPLYLDDALSLLFKLLSLSQLPPSLLLASPQSQISLLQLANLIISQASTKINLTFDTHKNLPNLIEQGIPFATDLVKFRLTHFLTPQIINNLFSSLPQANSQSHDQAFTSPSPSFSPPSSPLQPQSSSPFSQPSSSSLQVDFQSNNKPPLPRPISSPQPSSPSFLSRFFSRLFKPSPPPSLDDLKKELRFVPLQSSSSSSRFSLSKLHLPFHLHFAAFTLFLKRFLVVFSFYLLTLFVSNFLLFFSLKKIVSHPFSSQPFVGRLGEFTSFYLQKNLDVYSYLPSLANKSNFNSLANIITATHQFFLLLPRFHSLLLDFQKLTQYVLNNQDMTDINHLFTETSSSLANLYPQVSYLVGLLPAHPPSFLPAALRSQYIHLYSSLHQSYTSFSLLNTIFPTLPQLLGVGGQKTYLLLLQNNMELRPTGGFIGSFALLNFDNGQLFDFQVYDVYQADGQLKGHVKPPLPIKKYLGEANWYLRDSNWDPNFPVSAQRAAWFLEKTLAKKVDGVFALNLYAIQNILRAIGPVYLPDYQEKITADNLFVRAESHAEVNFFPGSTQKKEFLASLANVLFARLQDLSFSQTFSLAQALATSLHHKDLLLTFFDSTLQGFYASLNFTGHLIDFNCPSQFSTCFQDYLFVVDANLGVNKANYFLQRNSALDVVIDKSHRLLNTLTLNYTNTATSTTWPAGDYKNYQRLYLPKNAYLQKLIIDGQEQDLDSLDFTALANYHIYGYFFTVPIKKSLTVKVIYTQSLDTSSPFTYTLYWQKQPGVGEEKRVVSIHYPLYLSPATISPQAKLSPQTLTFTSDNLQDHLFLASFTKK